MRDGPAGRLTPAGRARSLRTPQRERRHTPGYRQERTPTTPPSRCSAMPVRA